MTSFGFVPPARSSLTPLDSLWNTAVNSAFNPAIRACSAASSAEIEGMGEAAGEGDGETSGVGAGVVSVEGKVAGVSCAAVSSEGSSGADGTVSHQAAPAKAINPKRAVQCLIGRRLIAGDARRGKHTLTQLALGLSDNLNHALCRFFALHLQRAFCSEGAWAWTHGESIRRAIFRRRA